MKNKYSVMMAAVVLGLTVTLFAVENESRTSAEKPMLLESNGETIAELSILKGARFEIAAKRAKYNEGSQRWTIKGDVRIEIKHEGGSPVLVKADEIESGSRGQ